MKKQILVLLTIFFLSHANAQTTDKTYLSHFDNYSTIYSYEVDEITIHSDSTYTSKSWNIFNKKEWKRYKSHQPEISKGRITPKGEYYILTEYRNSNKTDYFWTVKISDKKLNFYYPNKKGKLRKTMKYKRIL